MRARWAALATAILIGTAMIAQVTTNDDAPEPVPILSVTIDPARMQLAMVTHGCPTVRPEVAETTEAVTVTVRGDDDGSSGCFVTVNLSGPMGDRYVLDGATGKRLG